jgi:hypothetical protein
MTFYNYIENVRTIAINLTHGEPWHGARDKAYVFDSLDAARREYMKLQEENTKLRERCADLYAEMITYSKAPNYNASVWAPRLREVGVEVIE